MNVGDKITYEANDYPKSVPKGTIGTVTNVRLSCVEFTVDGGDGYEWCARHGEYAPYKPTTGTLAELNVKAGDVVEFVEGGNMYTIMDDMCLKSHQSGDRIGYRDCWDTCHKFRIISRAQPTPTPLGELTDAEQAALLLAHHRGERIEMYSEGYGWESIINPQFNTAIAYRIAPADPKRETVTLSGSARKGNNVNWALSSVFMSPDTHRITFNTVDGVPDCGSIKMEAV